MALTFRDLQTEGQLWFSVFQIYANSHKLLPPQAITYADQAVEEWRKRAPIVSSAGRA